MPLVNKRPVWVQPPYRQRSVVMAWMADERLGTFLALPQVKIARLQSMGEHNVGTDEAFIVHTEGECSLMCVSVISVTLQEELQRKSSTGEGGVSSSSGSASGPLSPRQRLEAWQLKLPLRDEREAEDEAARLRGGAGSALT